MINSLIHVSHPSFLIFWLTVFAPTIAVCQPNVVKIRIEPERIEAVEGTQCKIFVDVDVATNSRLSGPISFNIKVERGPGTIAPAKFDIQRINGGRRAKGTGEAIYTVPKNAAPGDVLINVCGGQGVVLLCLPDAISRVYGGNEILTLTHPLPKGIDRRPQPQPDSPDDNENRDPTIPIAPLIPPAVAIGLYALDRRRKKGTGDGTPDDGSGDESEGSRHILLDGDPAREIVEKLGWETVENPDDPDNPFVVVPEADEFPPGLKGIGFESKDVVINPDTGKTIRVIDPDENLVLIVGQPDESSPLESEEEREEEREEEPEEDTEPEEEEDSKTVPPVPSAPPVLSDPCAQDFERLEQIKRAQRQALQNYIRQQQRVIALDKTYWQISQASFFDSAVDLAFLAGKLLSKAGPLAKTRWLKGEDVVTRKIQKGLRDEIGGDALKKLVLDELASGGGVGTDLAESFVKGLVKDMFKQLHPEADVADATIRAVRDGHGPQYYVNSSHLFRADLIAAWNDPRPDPLKNVAKELRDGVTPSGLLDHLFIERWKKRVWNIGKKAIQIGISDPGRLVSAPGRLMKWALGYSPIVGRIDSSRISQYFPTLKNLTASQRAVIGDVFSKVESAHGTYQTIRKGMNKTTAAREALGNARDELYRAERYLDGMDFEVERMRAAYNTCLTTIAYEHYQKDLAFRSIPIQG